MGLGKTMSVLTALDYMLMAGVITTPTLVCAPLRVAGGTWPDEAAKWSHLRHIDVMPIIGDPKTRTRALMQSIRAGNNSVYTINYENLSWLETALSEEGIKWPFGYVVPDESTKIKGLRVSARTSKSGKEYIQGQGGARAKALAKMVHKYKPRITELTGTPSPNGLKDLWGQIWYLDGGQRLGRSYDAFMSRWFKKSFDGYSFEVLPHAMAEVQILLRDICLTVDIADYQDIAAPVVNTIYVDLPSKARKLYDDMERDMFLQIKENQVEAFNQASCTIKCLQLANGAIFINGSNKEFAEVHDVKIQALEDVLEEAAGMPVLVAYHFKPDLARLMRAFPDGINIATPDGLRRAKKGEGRVWFGHPDSIGHGVDGLQEHCNICAFFGHWWNLETFLQFIERIGGVRQMQAGRNRPVFVYHIVARDTVDEIVMARRDSKREVQDLLLEAMKRRGIK
jgi:SNF2 family DNA or RNA helicase